MISDLELLKKLGFNMVRKHVSIAETTDGRTYSLMTKDQI
jgi:hypothetical protein